jgi:hypothetical protein
VDSEAEAAETQVWLAFAVRCGCLDTAKADSLSREYHGIISTLVGMRTHPETWIIREP